MVFLENSKWGVGVMTKHDKAVFTLCRSFLKKGDDHIQIGQKVVSRRKIVNQLRKEFPERDISIYGINDASKK